MATKMYVVQHFDFDGVQYTWQDLRSASPTEDLAVAIKLRDRKQHSGNELRIIERVETVIEA